MTGGLPTSSNGAPYNARWNNGVDSFIQKQSYGAKWLWSPNNLSQSVAGIKMSQPLPFLSGPFLSGWSIVGTWEWGFNPYYGFPAAAQQSQVNQNGRALLLQGAGADSSRTGQPDNSQAFIGLSNTTYGTLTAGRVNTLSLDAINSYDPMGGSYAFSPLGFSGSFAGFGDTEAARANTALKYRLNFPSNLFGLPGASFRVGGLWQWGGYDQGNGTEGLYQGQVGGDFNLFGGTPYAGTLSLDAIGSWAKDEVNLSTFTGTCATLTKGPFAGQTGCTSGLPTVLCQHRLEGDAVEQHRLFVHGQVQVASPDSLRRVCVAQAGGSKRHLSERLPDHRRLERSRDHPLDLPRREEILADAMDQLHDLRCSEDRSLLLGRRQIRHHPAARRNRRLLLPRSNRLQHHRLAPAPSSQLSHQTVTKSPLDASTAAPAPARKTSFRRSSTIGRTSASTSTRALWSPTFTAVSPAASRRPRTSRRPPAFASSSDLSFTANKRKRRRRFAVYLPSGIPFRTRRAPTSAGRFSPLGPVAIFVPSLRFSHSFQLKEG